MHIAFLGTGLMGAPMVCNLAKAGHKLHVWNRSIGKAENLSKIAQVHSTATSAVRDVQIVICMLADGEVTREVLSNKGVIEAARVGTLFINMGSVEPQIDRQLATLSASNGKKYLDAPVSGGVKGAEDANLTIFVGGDSADMEFARPVFSHLGRSTLIGPISSGQSAKLANQLIVAITIGAVAEAFKLAESVGCNPTVLRQALRGGFADSRILESHGERMIKRNFEPGGKVKTQLKDIRNALAVASESNLKLPLSKSVEHSFNSLIEDYDCADLDHSAYYLWLDKTNPK